MSDQRYKDWEKWSKKYVALDRADLVKKARRAAKCTVLHPLLKRRIKP